MKGGWVYIMTDKPNGTLYVGVTSDIAVRAFQYREGLVEGFTKQYGLKRLVYTERHEEIMIAIQREKNVKHWRREWKVRLIHSINPDWDDLYETLLRLRKTWMAGSSPAMTRREGGKTNQDRHARA